MSLTKVNRSAATLTKNRTEGSIVPASGMCVTCVVDGGNGDGGLKLLLLNQHHLGSDGGSRTVMRQQLLRIYRAVYLGLEHIPVPRFPFTYPQWAQWQVGV